MRDDRIYLKHIVDCITAIQDYTSEGRDVFFHDRKTQKAVIRELQELAESTQRLSVSLKERHSTVPWNDISGFRNVLVHDYLGLNLDRIWSIIERDLPSLRSVVEEMLRELEQDGHEGARYWGYLPLHSLMMVTIMLRLRG